MICSRCPRQCGRPPDQGIEPPFRTTSAYCRKPADSKQILFAKSMRHFWEEPCISGTGGSGALFFSGCNLGCAFCQNHRISNAAVPKGKPVSGEDIVTEMFRLRDMGCHNINFVTGSHLTSELLPVMNHAREKGLDLPYLWNSSAYETVGQVRSLDRIIDIYLPDMKFYSADLSDKVAGAPDYFEIAGKALLEMVRQIPKNNYIEILNDNINDDKSIGCNDNKINRIMKRGVLIRHLVLPGFYTDSIKILEWIEANLSNQVALSLMSQYVPDFYEIGCREMRRPIIPSLKRKLTTFEYGKVIDKAIALGFKEVYIQNRNAAEIKYVPEF